MQQSMLTALLAGHERLRSRIDAIVRTARWADPEADLDAPIPIDQLAWAVATVLPKQEGIDAEDTVDGEAVGYNLEQAAEAITDDMLQPFILKVALPRLEKAAGDAE